jgi:hypothetical protein
MIKTFLAMLVIFQFAIKTIAQTSNNLKPPCQTDCSFGTWDTTLTYNYSNKNVPFGEYANVSLQMMITAYVYEEAQTSTKPENYIMIVKHNIVAKPNISGMGQLWMTFAERAQTPTITNSRINLIQNNTIPNTSYPNGGLINESKQAQIYYFNYDSVGGASGCVKDLFNASYASDFTLDVTNPVSPFGTWGYFNLSTAFDGVANRYAGVTWDIFPSFNYFKRICGPPVNFETYTFYTFENHGEKSYNVGLQGNSSGLDYAKVNFTFQEGTTYYNDPQYFFGVRKVLDLKKMTGTNMAGCPK